VVALDALPPDALMADCGGMGVPTVGLEKLDAFEVRGSAQHQPTVLLVCPASGGARALGGHRRKSGRAAVQRICVDVECVRRCPRMLHS
jgi:hypothetical protein